MITLTAEAAQQIEEALKLAIRTSYSEHNNIKFEAALAIIRAARAQEQAEQELMSCEQCEELSADKARWYRMADMFAQQAQELKDVLRQALNLIEGEWPKGDEVAQPIVDKIKKLVGERSDG